MTQSEFAKGWKLLILQPWGWRYRSLTDGKPSEESRIQLEFYYDKLKWAHPEAWWEVAQLYAQGSEWPSIRELKHSCHAINHRFMKKIEDHREDFTPMDPKVRQMLEKIGKRMPA